MEKLADFQNNKIKFIETLAVKDGVECDTYEFATDKSKVLAIVRVISGCSTPLQRILKGNRTIEGYLSGKGNFRVVFENGESKTYEFPREDGTLEFTVERGQIMQWQAAEDTELIFYEICEQPYEDGRFENLPD